MTLDGLLDDLDDLVDELLDVDYTRWKKEDPFIEYTERVLDGEVLKHDGDTLSFHTKSIHKSPIVDFYLPNGNKTSKELGDFLFIVESDYFMNPSERRVMLTQAKFSKKTRSWSIDLYQYFLISNLPSFTINRPGPQKSFDFGEMSDSSFANFVFAGHFDDPFYVTGDRMNDGISNFNYSSKNATFNRSNLKTKLEPIEYTRSILKRLIRGSFGVSQDSHPDLGNLVSLLENISAGKGSSGHCITPDGGIPNTDRESEFTIVYINVEKSGEHYY